MTSDDTIDDRPLGAGRARRRRRRRAPHRVFVLTSVAAFVATGLNAAALLNDDAPAWFQQVALALMACIAAGHLLRAGLGRA